MANSQHLCWLRGAVTSWNNRRKSNPFSPDLSSENLSRMLGGHEREDIREITVRLSGINLSGANLSNAMLRDTDLTGAAFLQAILTNANLIGSNFTQAMFVDSQLRNTKLHSANFSKTRFFHSDLSLAQFVGANLGGAQLWQCDLNGTHLYNADVIATDFIQSRPWTARLYFPATRDRVDAGSFDRKEVDGINALLDDCREFRKTHGDDIVLYFRGESRSSWDLYPSVMRVPSEGEAAIRSAEAEMLNDLMTRQPEPFSGLRSALAQWVLAQHHGLRTRLLDITRNPLVALYYACDDDGEEDGRLHVFAVPRSLIKPFDSDTIRIISNFAKLPRGEQNLLLGKTAADAQGDIFPSAAQGIHEGLKLFALAKAHLHSILRKESPYFEDRIDVRDLFRVFVVEPQQMFERIRAQSGAFFLSAFHERFERDEILNWNRDIPIYSHYVLKVPQCRKRTMLDDLGLLNVTRETLFPSVDEAARAITQQHLGRAK